MTAAQLKSLKARVKAVMAKRGGNGSVSAYAGSQYDFDEEPRDYGPVKLEHGQKTVNILLRINTKIGGMEVGAEVNADGQGIDLANFTNDRLDAVLGKLEAENAQAARGYYKGNYVGNTKVASTESSSCSASCTGICVGNCFGTCNGCSTLCGGGCKGACQGCKGCSGKCTSSCQGCEGGCSSGCQTSSK